MNTSPDRPAPPLEPQSADAAPAAPPQARTIDPAIRPAAKISDLEKPAPAPAPRIANEWETGEELEGDEENFADEANDDDDSDDEDEADEAAADTPELAAWKDELRQDFEAWLATLAEIPESGDPSGDDANDAPDLYSFYAQFAAAGAESRKANRRTAEAMSQWGDTLARFESGLQPLRETVAQLSAAQPKAGRMTRAHCLVLVELLDRMHRLARAFEAPPTVPAMPTAPASPTPKRSWFGPSAGADNGATAAATAAAYAAANEAWRAAWTAQRQGLDILVSHLEGWLAKEGVTRQTTLGQPFDPAFMMAVAAEAHSNRPPQTVLEETAAGYLRDGELLRAAQVKVSRRP